MNISEINASKVEREKTIRKVCDYLGLEDPKIFNTELAEVIKELCVMRLCRIVGITGTYNYKSEFFNFFASIMGEALCEKLKIKIHIAKEELRLIKYEHTNLIDQVKIYLENESLEEAFLDAFELADRFKYLINKLKKT